MNPEFYLLRGHPFAKITGDFVSHAPPGLASLGHPSPSAEGLESVASPYGLPRPSHHRLSASSTSGIMPIQLSA